jgi:choline dehydrogenase-like flavoprotein
MGGMRMGKHPKTSVTDHHGMVHGLENVFVADGSVFPSSGAQNPTLTIMATALRNATKLFGHGHHHVIRGDESHESAGPPVVATAAGLAGGLAARGGTGKDHGDVPEENR